MSLKPRDAVIVAATRSPIGRAFKGSLRDMRPDDLAAAVFKATLTSVPNLDPAEVEDLILGCGQPAGEQGYNLARVVSLLTGLPNVPGTTVNRYCSSSLQTIRMAFHAIAAGEGDVFLTGGIECVSRFRLGKSDGLPNTKNPMFDGAQARTEAHKNATDRNAVWSSQLPARGLPNIYVAMGETAEIVAEVEGVTRREMDEFAALSQNRAEQAQNAGHFDAEITPITTPDGTLVSTDDCPRHGTTAEKLAGLRPVFRTDGRVTAGNACPLNDGAAAILVMSAERAKSLGIMPLAKIIASGLSGLRPELMGLGPIEASRQALGRAKMKITDIDRVEINEAFAAQVIPSMKHLEVPLDKLNVNGGAIALGHPFGMTGARIMATLLNNLKSSDTTIGLETMCVGGGQGMAMIVERLN